MRSLSSLHRLLAGLLTALAVAAPGASWGQLAQDNVVEALDGSAFPVKSTGGSSGTLNPATDWNLWSNGRLETTSAIPSDSPATLATGNPHTVQVTAYGSVAGGVWPTLEVWLDGVKARTFTVGSSSPTVYSFTSNIKAGMRKVQLRFTNDAIVNGADRNLFVRKLTILAADPTAQLPAGAGTFAMQSISLGNAFFSTNEALFGLNTPCASSVSPGCANIDFIKRVGGNDVTLTSRCTIQSGASWCAPQVNWNNEETALRVAIRYARSLGLKVTLKPFVLSPEGNVLQVSGWVPPNPEEFFISLEGNLKRHARIAREEGASLLMLGAEMGGQITASQPLNNQCARWLQLITNVRAEAAAVTNVPAGSTATLPLTYSPTAAGFWNSLQANEAPYVCFWGELDYIGLNAYHHMNLQPGSTPTLRLPTAWTAYKRMFDAGIDVAAGNPGWNFAPPLTGYDSMDLGSTVAGRYRARFGTTAFSTKWYVDYVIDDVNARFKTRLTARGKYPLKGLITEVGVPSAPEVQDYWGSTNTGEGYTSDWLVYVDEQARSWEGYLRAFRGDSRIAGISMWELRPYHTPDWTSTPADILVDYDFNGKLNAAGQKVTEEAVCRWFKRGGTALNPCTR